MLKVVGASWLQTRISTYILVAVTILGIGAIIFSKYGHVEKDGTYSATVSWNHKGGYHIDFWGQGNDLANVRLNAARAYYKTGIFESGFQWQKCSSSFSADGSIFMILWSIIEIETSSKYPDKVQAYAAGLLEGSLTWQMIHHHWHNTVNVVCEKWAGECQKLMQFLHKNTAIVRERAERLAATDPFWYMVWLFYIQLDGLEAGWRFAVRRSRQPVDMNKEHFLWLAMAADLPDLERVLNDSESYRDYIKGMIFLKNLSREGLSPLIAIGHTTAAPYAKMLRLLKKYTFGYHVLSTTPALIPSRSIIMSSYPGALSSHDEFYLIQGEDRELIIAGTPLTVTNRNLRNFMNAKDQVMSSARVMAANRLAMNGYAWSRSMSLQNSIADAARQWVTVEPRDGIVWLVEQLSGLTRTADISERFAETDMLWAIGEVDLRETNVVISEYEKEDDDVAKSELVARLRSNITTAEHFRKLIRGYSHEKPAIENEDQTRISTNRGDLEKVELPFGIIDTKIVLADVDGVESFEVTSGPNIPGSTEPFRWSTTFPNVLHIGQPDVFDFDSVTPLWVWV